MTIWTPFVSQMQKRYVPCCSYTVNTNKSAAWTLTSESHKQALCINTSPAVIAGLRELGIETPEHIKHLGLYLGKNMQDTVTETMRQIDPKALKRRIFATTPHTDLLHRALLLNTAYIPMYNHVFKALPTLKNQGASFGLDKSMAIP
jgi:hypothetical protein